MEQVDAGRIFLSSWGAFKNRTRSMHPLVNEIALSRGRENSLRQNNLSTARTCRKQSFSDMSLSKSNPPSSLGGSDFRAGCRSPRLRKLYPGSIANTRTCENSRSSYYILSIGCSDHSFEKEEIHLLKNVPKQVLPVKNLAARSSPKKSPTAEKSPVNDSSGKIHLTRVFQAEQQFSR